MDLVLPDGIECMPPGKGEAALRIDPACGNAPGMQVLHNLQGESHHFADHFRLPPPARDAGQQDDHFPGGDRERTMGERLGKARLSGRFQESRVFLDVIPCCFLYEGGMERVPVNQRFPCSPASFQDRRVRIRHPVGKQDRGKGGLKAQWPAQLELSGVSPTESFNGLSLVEGPYIPALRESLALDEFGAKPSPFDNRSPAGCSGVGDDGEPDHAG